MCDRWRKSAAAFYADMGDPPPGATIERVDNDKGYEPENCVWASRLDQARNRRNSRLIEHDGLVLTLAEWAERTGIKAITIADRLERGWTAQRALEAPTQSGHTGPGGRTIVFRGRAQSIRAWAKELGLAYGTLKYRLASGMSSTEALSKPPEKRGRGSPIWWETHRKTHQRLSQTGR